MGVVKQIYAGVDPKLHNAAALSTLAHVEHLIEQGLVKAHGELALDTRVRGGMSSGGIAAHHRYLALALALLGASLCNGIDRDGPGPVRT
jgi:hypothetical protein